MKIIEAMKKVKYNKVKMAELQDRISKSCSNLNIETPVYGEETAAKIAEWAQSCTDISQENIRLLCAIQRTNLQTKVTIELGGKQVTKTIAEWVWRRREYAKLDLNTYKQFSDRGLREGVSQSSTGNLELKIVRHFNPIEVMDKQELYRAEPSAIDAALEIVNATTDLLEK